MTRVIAGRFGGHRLRVPPAGTRPTTDRVREALFSALESRLDLTGARVLDLFAGSGALGLEAASRGAASVTFVEADGGAAKVLRGNVAGVRSAAGREAPELTVRQGRLPGVLTRGGVPGTDGGVDLVLADPPYDRAGELDEPVLRALVTEGLLAPGALVVWERSARSPDTRWPSGLDPIFSRTYGETAVEIGEAVETGEAAPAEPAPEAR